MIQVRWNNSREYTDLGFPFVPRDNHNAQCCFFFYYPTVLVIVQKARETSTNIPGYCTVGYCTVPCTRSSCSFLSSYWRRLKKANLDNKSLIRCFGVKYRRIFLRVVLYFDDNGTVLVIVQKARETSTNIPRYCTVGYRTVPCARSSCYNCSFLSSYWKRLGKVKLDNKSLIRWFGMKYHRLLYT